MCAVASLWLARARPLPALPHMHLLRPGLLPVPLISILTVAGEWAALPGTPRTRAGSELESGPYAGAARGDPAEPPNAGGSVSLFFLFFFLFASSRI